MSDGGRENFSGWLRVGCGAFFVVMLPVWILVTGATIQLSPDLNGLSDFDVDGILISGEAGWATWIMIGLQTAFGMVLAMPLILSVVVVARAVSSTQQLRSASQRAQRDAEVSADVVLADVDWATLEPEDEIHSGP
ncbi:MAG: hypothetical protein GWP91_25580 [Rhodobacterales bacterium]|nr:hypothetical protein [Rhodobacterales bacterium]